jgi:hypothetical protein
MGNNVNYKWRERGFFYSQTRLGQKGLIDNERQKFNLLVEFSSGDSFNIRLSKNKSNPYKRIFDEGKKLTLII